jgi:hypothetical protein
MTDISSKYPDYLQAVIARMASNSFVAKGWSLTLASALLGIALKDGKPPIAIIAALPTCLFWAFDAYFLSLERKFRALFAVATKAILTDQSITFDMNPGRIGVKDLISAAIGPALLLSHASILATICACVVLLHR